MTFARAVAGILGFGLALGLAARPVVAAEGAQARGQGAPPIPESAPGLATRPGGGTLVDTPAIDAAQAKEADAAGAVALEASRRHYDLAAMLCGAAGVVSLWTGIYYWSRAHSYSDSANRTVVFDQSTYDNGKRAETMQWIFFGVGAAAVASGAGLFVYGHWFLAPKPTKVGLAPMAAPGVAGLAAVGSF